ncbi:putative transposase-like protein [Trichonephila clavata]|uniref:Putative transposase-like protein n=1 Tax=Trichonephila clavata TaxID=2740835 RepID=A0A8X6GST2_TRICU|nr:putative transposase-like protein [Trichonephila clavata]
MYEFFRRSSFAQIHKELGIFSQAVADWRNYASDVLIDYIVVNTEKLGGGGGKTVEVDESKIGKRKYNRGHFVEGQWVFGGVERETGRCFLVAVHDRTAETLLGLIESWIEPGTTVISDCWKSYERLSERGYNHLTVNHSLEFVDSETGAHTNTIEVTWRHFKASLPEYNRRGRFEGYIAWFMFRKICFALKQDPFIKFLDLVRNINWADWQIVSGGGVEESNS